MLRRLFIGLMAAAVAMIPNHLEAKSGNHEAGKVYEYEYLAEAHAACGNWSQNAIFYYSDKTLELTGSHFSTNRICSPEKIKPSSWQGESKYFTRDRWEDDQTREPA